ncbi:MAG TPA: FAD-dependent oxidoreductase [Actinomycetes bacterium]|nr:FAD-dependent oxidoreductase [Actinomycetes bacterium]
MSPTTTPSAADDLRTRLTGRVLTAGDEGYDAARIVMLGGTDPHPAVIARPVDDADVAAVVSYARDNGLALAVRSGGHSGAAYGTVDDGIVLDLRDMAAIDIDVEGRTAWVESGVTAGGFTVAAAEHGLAVGFGDTGSVGLGGLVTGGGVGYLVRKHGLTVDNLLAADVVTADGQLRRVDADTEPELFWAIRGGGGNVGVVTRFRFRLAELPQIVGGMLVLPATPETVAGFLTAAEEAPEEMSTIANVMNCPPLPFVDESVHGSLVIMGMLCWSGDVEAGMKAIEPFVGLAEPLANMVRPMSYPEMYPPEDPDYHPTAVARTMFLDGVDVGRAKAVLDALESSDAVLRAAQLRVLGGAAARVADDETAYAHRSAKVMANVAAFYDGPDDRADKQRWVEETSALLHTGDDRAYVNFLTDEGEERVRAAYPGATWDRLAAVKATYDPQNLFRRNQNVPPSRSAAG